MNFTKELVAKYSDVRVSLVNGSEKVVMPCMKYFLEGTTPYFRNLFETFPHETDITLNVIDIPTAEHLLLTYHNIPPPKDTTIEENLYMIHTKTYLNMTIYNNDFDLKVTEEHIPLMYFVFLSCDLVNNLRLIHILHKNLPEGYNTSTFDSQIVAKLNANHKMYVIRKYNLYTFYLESGVMKDNNSVFPCAQDIKLHYSCPHTNLFAYYEDDKIKVIDLVQNKLKFQTKFTTEAEDDDYSYNDDALIISPQGKYIAIIGCGYEYSITVWNMKTNNMSKYDGNIIIFSPNEELILIQDDDITIYNADTNDKITSISIGMVRNLKYVFTNTRQSLLLINLPTEHTINIVEVDIHTGVHKRLARLRKDKEVYNYCVLSFDDKLIAFQNRKYIRVYDLVACTMVKEHIVNLSGSSGLFIFSDDNKRIIFGDQYKPHSINIYDTPLCS